MRTGFGFALMVTLLIGGGYWYYTALALCNVPISYRIGDIDARFNITTGEVEEAVSAAESLWEDGTGRDLFTYDPAGKVLITFVYDERQRLADEEDSFLETLEKKEGMSDTVKAQYENLLREYEALRNDFTEKTDQYETKLAAYNTEVAAWNKKGGAPKDVFGRLEETQTTLAREEKRLNAEATELNEIVRKMNVLGDRGNSLINDYNSLANEYNDRFSEGGEFTQGDYGNKVMHVYEFDSKDELIIVLAHEFGHALSLDHVEKETAIMHHTMGKQVLSAGLTPQDRTLFTEQCGTESGVLNTLSLLLGLAKKSLFGG